MLKKRINSKASIINDLFSSEIGNELEIEEDLERASNEIEVIAKFNGDI